MTRQSAQVACLVLLLFASVETAARAETPEETFAAAAQAFGGGDIDKALELYGKAAEQGYVPAMTALGTIHLYSLAGDQSDVAEAVKWVSAAAEKGDPRAQYHLADMYFMGTGVPTDEKRAYDLYLAAASQKHTLAMWQLAYLHRNGQAGLERDEVEGLKWLLLSRKYAMEASDQKAEALASQSIEDWSAQMAKEEIAEAQSRADTWKP